MNAGAPETRLIDELLDPRNPPKYNFDLFQKAEEDLERINAEDNVDGVSVQTLDITGLLVSDPWPVPKGQEIRINTLHNVAYGNVILTQPDDERLKGALIKFVTQKDRPWLINDPNYPKTKEEQQKICCKYIMDDVPKFRAFAEQFEKSEFGTALVAHLEKHARNMERVDRITAFGLGRLAWEEPHKADDKPPHPAKNWIQHLTCLTIKRVLEEKQGSSNIEILSQDPDYCDDCVTLLGAQSITAYQSAVRLFTSPEYLDEHTFVVTKAAEAPIRQIVFDLTAHCGGPAGILCDQPEEDDVGPEDIKRETPWWDAPSLRWLEFKGRKGNRDMELELDDSDLPATWSKKESYWQVFEAVRVYLKKKSGDT